MDLSSYLNSLQIENNAIFDPIRKKWLIAQPEELVRQCLIRYLIDEKKLAASRLSIEKAIRVHEMTRRFDIVYFDQKGHPLLLVECKSPSVPLTENVLEQAVWYNFQVKAPYLLLSNGKQTLWYRVMSEEKSYQALSEYGPDKL